MIFDLLLLDSPGDFAAALLVLAFAIIVIVFLIDDDDLPCPRLYRVPARG